MAKSTPPRRPSAGTVAKAGSASRKRASAPNTAATAANVPAAEPVRAVSLKRAAVNAKPAVAAPTKPDAPTHAATKPSAPPSPGSPAAQSSRGESGGLIAAGLAGGLVAAAVMLAVQWATPEESAGNDLQATVDSLSNELESLRGDYASLQETVAAQAGVEQPDAASSSDLAALREQVAAIEASVSAEPDTSGLDDVRGEIEALTADRASLTERIDAIEAALAEPGAEAEVASALAAAGLKAAIDRGGSFEGELEAYTASVGDGGVAETLRPFAAEGVPTREQIVERFPSEARQMLAASMGAAASDGVIDRLMSSALSVVTVRPTGEVEGDYPKAIIARMEARLTEGDFEAALAEWEKLPENARSVSEDYAADIRSRLEADRIVTDALSAASSAIGENTN